jgi:hypothetical protein
MISRVDGSSIDFKIPQIEKARVPILTSGESGGIETTSSVSQNNKQSAPSTVTEAGIEIA